MPRSTVSKLRCCCPSHFAWIAAKGCPREACRSPLVWCRNNRGLIDTSEKRDELLGPRCELPVLTEDEASLHIDRALERDTAESRFVFGVCEPSREGGYPDAPPNSAQQGPVPRVHEDDVGEEPFLATLTAEDLIIGGVHVEHHESLVLQIAKGDPVGPCERMMVRADDDDLVSNERDPVVLIAGEIVGDHDRHVDLVHLQSAEEVGLLTLEQINLGVHVVYLELRESRVEIVGFHQWHCAEAHPVMRSSAEPPQTQENALVVAVRIACKRKEHLAGGRQVHSSRAPDEEIDAELFLKGLDLLGQRRLRDVAILGGA